MKKLMVWVVAVLALAATAGCTEKGIHVSLRSFPNPVMVSPVLRIGDTAPPQAALPEYGRFTGEHKVSVTAAGGSHREGNYTVHESSRTEAMSDDIAYQISKSTSGRTDLLIVLDEVQAGSWGHWSIIGIRKEWVAVEGRVLDPAPLRRRAK